ncbi:MAG: hypothetical protein KJO98_02255, partial [Rhodothermia bacterium]|nr:hypothetical protein [Rhodothermia bacterium]
LRVASQIGAQGLDGPQGFAWRRRASMVAQGPRMVAHRALTARKASYGAAGLHRRPGAPALR